MQGQTRKIRCLHRFAPYHRRQNLPQLDRAAVTHYANLFDELQATLQNTLMASFASLQDPTAFDFFRLDGILHPGSGGHSSPTEREELHREAISGVVDKTMAAITESRTVEGEKLEAPSSNWSESWPPNDKGSCQGRCRAQDPDGQLPEEAGKYHCQPARIRSSRPPTLHRTAW